MKKDQIENERKIIFKATYWSFEDENDELVIYVSGRTKKEESVQIKIEGFTPYVYLKLPKLESGKWTESRCKSLFEFIVSMSKDHAPLNYKKVKRYDLNYLRPVEALFLTFKSRESLTKLKWNLSRKMIYITGIGRYQGSEFVVYEANIDPIIKFTAIKNIDLAGWIEATEKLKDEEKGMSIEERKFSTADIDMVCDRKNVNRYDMKDNISLNPTYCSFDIECYSKNHNSKLPDPEESKNCVFQISMVFGKINEDKKKKYLLTLHDPLPIPDVKIIRCSSEKNLLLAFTKYIKKHNPDIYIGYNIMKFDWGYMLTRTEKFRIKQRFLDLTRIVGKEANVIKNEWTSGAYGEQKFSFVDSLGRINVDVLIEVERNYKLPTYSLNTVSEFFLNEKKDDITPRELFILFQITDEILPKLKTKPSEEELKYYKSRIKEIMDKDKIHGEVKKLRRELLECSSKKFKDTLRKALTITGKYCVQDTLLPITLVHKLNLWISMEELSSIMMVPISYLHTRGQQIRVIAQVYRETLKCNIIIPPNNDKNSIEKVQGAIVINVKPGHYFNIGTLDFASLYPTTMIANNICYTTIVDDSDKIPDKECNVIEWESHKNCIHDDNKKSKKKKEEEGILCGNFKLRFKKVKYEYDEKTKKITMKDEGLMPRLERNLLQARKQVKKEMAKVEAQLKMTRGQASDEDVIFYKKMGWDIIKKGHYDEKKEAELSVLAKVLNSRQNAIKISCNSMYGAMGAKTGFIPFLKGASAVTAMGRKSIMSSINRIHKEFPIHELVYGDTDSCMNHYRGATLKEAFEYSRKSAKIATHHVKCLTLGVDENYKVSPRKGVEYTLNQIDPSHEDFKFLPEDQKIKVIEYFNLPIDLTFENMYGNFLILTKKRYIAYIVNENGVIVGMVKKGVALTRRQYCNYMKVVYKKMAEMIMENKPKDEVLSFLYEKVNELFSKQVQDNQLVLYTGVKSVIGYAKKKEIEIGGKKTKIYIDVNGKLIEDEVTKPDDPRLTYPNLPQCLLALKMIRRGTDVPPNTRLEYVYMENPDAVHQGEKIEEYSYYKENKKSEHIKIDKFLYLDKQLSTAIFELLNVKYPQIETHYENMEHALERVLTKKTLDEYKKGELARAGREYTSKIPEEYEGKEIIGWNALCKTSSARKIKGYSKFINKMKKQENNSPELSARQYKYIPRLRKVVYVIDSSKKKGPNEFDYEDEEEREVIQVCLRYYSRHVIDKLYKQYHIKKRQFFRSAQIGPKLRNNIRVMLLEDVKIKKKIYKKGRIFIIKETHKVDDTKNTFVFDLADPEKQDCKVLIEKISRDKIAPLYIKDKDMFKVIINARKGYQEVVDELRKKFSPIIFVD